MLYHYNNMSFASGTAVVLHILQILVIFTEAEMFVLS